MAIAPGNPMSLGRGRRLVFILGLVSAALLLGATSLAGAAPLAPSVRIDRPVVLAGAEGSVYVLVRFDVPEPVHHRGRPRPGLDLALVLDRSGSMADKGKIEYLKRAAKKLVDNLGRRDRLSIVEYDDRITVMWPFAPVESRAMIKRQIDRLEPRNATDLVGGMMRGVDELRDRPPRDGEAAVVRVLLLSDGLANRGVTDPPEIRRLVRRAKRDGIRISTMGLGLEYNEDLMQAIAENAGGSYYYIEHPNQMAGIFRRELEALFGTVARDAALRFSPDAAVRGVEVFGVASEDRGGDTLVALEDLYGGEQRAVLMRLDLDPRPAGESRLGTLEFSYYDVGDKMARRYTADLRVRVSPDRAAVEAAVDKEVVVEAALVEAERRHEETVRLYQSGRHAEARRRIDSLASGLIGRNADLDDIRLAKKIEALRVEKEQMAEAAAAPPGSGARAGYVKRSKQRLYRAKQGKRALYQLQLGDRGYEVRRLQEALAGAGAYSGPVDGRFSKQVTGAVESFQNSEGLTVDGIAGPATMQKLGIY